MLTLTFFNNKGGVGKTTLTVNVADALVDQGIRVLMVDADPLILPRFSRTQPDAYLASVSRA